MLAQNRHTFTALQLESLHVSKDELFKDTKETFDYALPQTWLDAFWAFCKERALPVTYDLITSSTVWLYPKGNYFGMPLTACTEVKQALEKYNL
jgi:hypothetical protein